MHVSTKALAVALALATAFACVAMFSEQSDGEVVDGFDYVTNGNTVIVNSYEGTDTVVKIPSEVTIGSSTYAVQSISGNAFRDNKDIVEVVIPSSVTTITANAFYGCSSLEFVTIEGTVEIGDSAFQGCSNLQFIDLKGEVSVTGDDAFNLNRTQPCTVRTSQETPLDGHSGSTTFNYVTADKFIVRYVLDGAPESITSIDFDIVEPDTTLAVPEEAKVEGYAINMYKGETSIAEGTTVTTDMVVTLSYDYQLYTVEFKVDGEVVKTEELRLGDRITPPADPVKKDDAQYFYKFSRWDGYTADMTVTGEHTFDAVFDTTLREYKVTFVSDGVIVSEETLPYGTVIEPPADPSKQSDLRFEYPFQAWSGYTSGATVQGDVTYDAIFLSIPILYEITFMNGEEVFKVVELQYGDAITAPEEVPTKASADGYDYTFREWEGLTEGLTVTGDATFNAVFDQSSQQSPDDGSSTTWIIIVAVVIVVVILALFVLRKHF